MPKWTHRIWPIARLTMVGVLAIIGTFAFWDTFPVALPQWNWHVITLSLALGYCGGVVLGKGTIALGWWDFALPWPRGHSEQVWDPEFVAGEIKMLTDIPHHDGSGTSDGIGQEILFERYRFTTLKPNAENGWYVFRHTILVPSTMSLEEHERMRQSEHWVWNTFTDAESEEEVCSPALGAKLWAVWEAGVPTEKKPKEG